jgi:hypothetical protein
VVCLILKLVFTTDFGIFLTPLVRLKSVKQEMCGNNFNSVLKEYSDPKLGKDFLEFIFDAKSSNNHKNYHENFSGETDSMVLGLLAWVF